MQPSLSVIMPVYNCQAYLGEAIDSILSQTYPDFELLIVDDASTDNSVEIIKGYTDSRIKLIQNSQNQKLAASLNKGISLAQGQFVARMDGDDIAYPTRFQRQVEYLQAEPTIQVLGTAVQVLKNGIKVNRIFPQSHEDIQAKLLFTCSLHHPTVMLRRQFLIDNRLAYRPEYPVAEDYDLWSRAIFKGTFKNLLAPLLFFRQHKAQESKLYPLEQKESYRNVQKSLLERLDMGLTDEDYRLFSLINKNEMADAAELEKIMLLMHRVTEQNNLKKVFDEDALTRLFGEKLTLWKKLLTAMMK